MIAKISVLIACLLMCTATVMSEEFVAEIDSTGEVEVEVAMEDTEAMLKYARKHMQEESEKKKVAEQKHQDEKQKKEEITYIVILVILSFLLASSLMCMFEGHNDSILLILINSISISIFVFGVLYLIFCLLHREALALKKQFFGL